MNYSCQIRIPFLTARHAQIAYNSLKVDREPKKDVKRMENIHENNILVVDFESNEARYIRVAVESYIDKINLILRTIQRFDH
ncbi:unnamed protein product [Didymodactylos carnosus]|uniref:L antigen family member 3 n=1 Tax=Didymodactylos carnosus TaxID=1234261 RepID=A0A814SBE7_9BILA|nr:unnamed protein product [Didymodactylos carnosus]CAF1503440.1 unnamed protein product [Didymodactylos carnosus]CAF3909386.1 unnamed protein product [Didymodactylos carnosus]CAF4291823.1 unnamed protein product [Didymodactylos carnosus]